VLIRLVYLFMVRVSGWCSWHGAMPLRTREILVIRHEIAVLRRRVARQKPGSGLTVP
jgi:hypothetical protein